MSFMIDILSSDPDLSYVGPTGLAKITEAADVNAINSVLQKGTPRWKRKIKRYKNNSGNSYNYADYTSQKLNRILNNYVN